MAVPVEDLYQIESELMRRGKRRIAGIDEAGRGPLAGPVVAAAVILPPDLRIPGLYDSKALSEKKREQLFRDIMLEAEVGVGIVSHRDIDLLNILNATMLAMHLAVCDLLLAPDHLIIDGAHITLPGNIPQECIVKGDQKSASIAAASIVAKVTRDRAMHRYHAEFPHYNFAKHKGYGTAEHIRSIRDNGPSPIHRKSFAPVSSYFA